MAETSLLLLDTSHGVGCRVVRHYHNPPGCQHKSLQRQQPWPVLKRHPQRHILCSGWRISEPFAKISGVRLSKSRVTKPRAPLLAALLGGVGGGGGLSAEPQAGVLQAAVPKTLPGQWKDAASCGAMPTSWVLRAPKAAMRTRHPSTAPTHKAATI